MKPIRIEPSYTTSRQELNYRFVTKDNKALWIYKFDFIPELTLSQEFIEAFEIFSPFYMQLLKEIKGTRWIAMHSQCKRGSKDIIFLGENYEDVGEALFTECKRERAIASPNPHLHTSFFDREEWLLSYQDRHPEIKVIADALREKKGRKGLKQLSAELGCIRISEINRFLRGAKLEPHQIEAILIWLNASDDRATCQHCGAKIVPLMSNCINPYCQKVLFLPEKSVK